MIQAIIMKDISIRMGGFMGQQINWYKEVLKKNGIEYLFISNSDNLGARPSRTLAQHFENTGDHIYKGEDNNESLANFKNDAIRSKLSDKIYDSSITLVLISPNMKENYKLENCK